MPRLALAGALVLLASLAIGSRWDSPQLALVSLRASLGSASLDSVVEIVRSLSIDSFLNGARTFWDIFGPGGRLHPGWFLEHKGHLVIEGVLVIVIFSLLLQQSFKPKQDQEEEPLTEQVRCHQDQHPATAAADCIMACAMMAEKPTVDRSIEPE